MFDRLFASTEKQVESFLGRLVSRALHRMGEETDLSTRIKKLAEVIGELPGNTEAMVVALNSEGSPVCHGGTTGITLSAAVSPYKALAEIRDLCLDTPRKGTEWIEVPERFAEAPRPVLANFLGVARSSPCPGMLLVVLRDGSKPPPSEVLDFLGWLVGESLRLESLRLHEDLNRLAAEEMSTEQLSVNPQVIAERLKSIFRADTVTILAMELGQFCLIATTDGELRRTAHVYEREQGLPGVVLSTGEPLRLADATAGAHLPPVAAMPQARRNLEKVVKENLPYRYLGIPMRTTPDTAMGTRGVIAGIIQIFRRSDAPHFTAEEEAVLLNFGGPLGAMLDASRILLHFMHIRRARSEAICISRIKKENGRNVPRFVYVNDGAQRLFGPDRSEILGTPAADLYATREEYGRIRGLLKRALENGEVGYGPVQTRVRGPDQDIRSVEISFRFLRAPHVVPTTYYTITVIRDNTEYIDFIDSFRHQLQAPIGAMLHTLLNLRERAAGNEWWADRLNSAIGQARDCSSLARNLAYMNDLLRGESFPFEPVNLAKMAIDTKHDFDHLLPEKKLSIHSDGSSLDSILESGEIWGHEGLLRQVFINLIDNAVKYSKAGTRIHVSGFSAGPQGRGFEVTNRGLRILPEDRDRIFTRGFRSRRAAAVTPDGSGMGLWLVHRIVKAHGARIRCTEVSDEDGELRTAFQVFFPEATLRHSVVYTGD